MAYYVRLKILCNLCWQLTKLRFSNQADKDSRSRRLLFDNFKHLGGVYIKFLQLLAISVDFMSGWAGPTEFEVFEAVALEDIDVQRLLQKELPGYQQYFRKVETVPFAAGSFAQVYRAELKDGSPVVVKILRPSLARNLNTDLRLLGIIAKVASWLYPLGTVDIKQAYRQFSNTTKAETDYLREVANAKWFYEYFKNTPDVLVPKTYADLSTPHIIIQDFVGGISLAEILALQRTGQDPYAVTRSQINSDLWKQLEILGTELLRATIRADFVLGDPHPGNIKLLDNNMIGLIDFGIVAPAPPNRHAWLNLMREYQKLYQEMFDPGSFTIATLKFLDEELAEALTLVARELDLSSHDLLDKIGESAAYILEEKWDEPTTQAYLRRRMMARLFGNTINNGNRFGVKLNLESMAMLKSAHTYLSLIGQIAQDGNKNFEIIQRALASAINLAEQDGLALEKSRHPLSIESALELVSSWLSQIADNDPFLYRQLTANINMYG